MTLIVRSTSKDVISLPVQLMELLNLSEGEEVKPVVEGQTLRLERSKRLEQFLALRGALQDDDSFDEALTYLQQAWEKWTSPTS